MLTTPFLSTDSGVTAKRHSSATCFKQKGTAVQRASCPHMLITLEYRTEGCINNEVLRGLWSWLTTKPSDCSVAMYQVQSVTLIRRCKIVRIGSRLSLCCKTKCIYNLHVILQFCCKYLTLLCPTYCIRHGCSAHTLYTVDSRY